MDCSILCTQIRRQPHTEIIAYGPFPEAAGSIGNQGDKQPFSVRFTPEGLHAVCESCRAARGVEELAREAL